MRLDPVRPYKPLDVGNGLVAGTVGPDGALLSLGVADPVHGRVVLTATAPFDERSRREPAAVRRWRAGLAARDRPGFGRRLREPREWTLVECSVPRIAEGTQNLTVVAPRGRRGVIQVLSGAVAPAADPLRGARLERAAYTQLTEGGPLPPLQPSSRHGAIGGVEWVADAALGWTAAAAGAADACAIAFARSVEAAVDEATALAADAQHLLETELTARGALARGHTPLVRRGLAYVLDCAASEVDGATALLADHEILPLVWTRDAYFCASLLLAAASRDHRARQVVDGFLHWCFERAERPDGWWPRSSLASGQAKDRAFQLDQQLYPPLLLAEHAAATGDRGLLERHGAAADDVLDRLLVRAGDGLVATTETPADDPLSEPYHFSSHVLLWRTMTALGRDGSALRRRIRERFTVDGRFAYAVGPFGARAYHDANDLPTALAPLWGFCDADDPVWRSTVAHGWSERNDGHFAGPLGGLGSLHTPHPWPLGDLQRVIVARAIGDAALEQDAWGRLESVETWDAMLPEAYDERTGAVASRHWFAWPTALRALLASAAG